MFFALTPPMNDDCKTTNRNWNGQLSQRAAKLSERGAHYFVGWLIGAGMDKPEITAEFEKVLRQIETDPKLRYCWREGDQTGDIPLSAEPATFSIFKGQPDAPNEAAPSPADPQPVQEERSASGVNPVETKLERPPVLTGLFGRLFRRQRIAA